MKKMKQSVKRFLEQRLTGTLLRFLSRQPLPRLQKWGDWLGDLMYRKNTKAARITRKNLSMAYPELSPEQLEEKVRLSLRETMKTGCEFGWCWMAPMDQILDQIKEVHGLDVLQRAHEAGKGVIFLGPHLGNWELLGHLINQHFPFSVMYAIPKNPALEQIIVAGRTRAGMKLAPANMKGVAQLLKLLKEGEMVGNLPDQEPDDRSGGVFAPFMGIEAFSPKLVTRLISKTGAKVVAGFAERLPNGEGFNIHFIDADDGIYSRDDIEAVTAMNRTVEALVAMAPDQYQWEYKRFKSRPEGEKRFY
ncbi:lysophospholipid acyltransferase family protein [Oceanospirillum sanctuarii]|uniref:lysophospholipid acyltransferase family protein n=1 Tax=Oceanospirillum sanctuarii TaxID=1434821 RepID=UPI000A39C8DA|nr:lysophospholipid acyltransferase family protein [Oceanospirillum sanctuarii]